MWMLLMQHTLTTEYNLTEIKKLIGNKNITKNIYQLQAYNSICGFIDFMIKGNGLLDYINIFSPNEYEKNKITLKCFQ